MKNRVEAHQLDSTGNLPEEIVQIGEDTEILYTMLRTLAEYEAALLSLSVEVFEMVSKSIDEDLFTPVHVKQALAKVLRKKH